MTGTVGLALAGTAFANHKTGDFPLPELIVAADFNEDGKLDLAVNVTGFDNVAILNGDGHGNFTLKEHVETDTLPKGLAVGDVNRDHHLDLVSINEWGYDIHINLGDGRGGFIGAGELNGDGDPIRIAVADLNNDGNLDLIANAPTEGKILIYFGQGHGSFSNSALELEDLPKDYSFAVGDLNHDGNADLVVIKDDQGAKAVVFLGDGAEVVTGRALGGRLERAMSGINHSSDRFLRKLEVHAVDRTTRETGAPEPAMVVEERSEQKASTLRLPHALRNDGAAEEEKKDLPPVERQLHLVLPMLQVAHCASYMRLHWNISDPATQIFASESKSGFVANPDRARVSGPGSGGPRRRRWWTA
jgi:hypothetical protein